MRFVATKTPEQQSGLMLHRTRHLLIRQQTAVINAIRAHLAEFGIVAPVGRNGVEQLLGVVADPSDKRVPAVARACLAALGAQLRALKAQILEFDRMIIAWHRSNETSKRFDDIPGVGPALATALVASVADPKAFRSGRNFSAWIGLVPKQHSSGGKDRLGSISKQGDRYLRGLFVAGALAVIRPNIARHGPSRRLLWGRSIGRSRPCTFWLRAGGCRLWAERAVSPGAHGSQACLGSRYSPPPQGLPCRCADDLAGCRTRPAPSAAHPRQSIDTGRRHAGQCQMARHLLAHRHERNAQGSFCGSPRAGRRWTTAADQGQGSATSPWGRGLAHRRTQGVGREEILSRQPAGQD
jgi:Transposase IS116/IS110/IS902 family